MSLTTITATKIQDISGRLLANGRVTFTGPVNAAGNPVAAIDAAGGPILYGVRTFLVVNGVITGDNSPTQLAAQVHDTTATNPANIGYTVRFYDNAGQIERPGYVCVQPSGATWSLDTYVPTQPALTTITNGLSAFQVAQANGYTGTAAQWIASLQGLPGPAGVVQGGNGVALSDLENTTAANLGSALVGHEPAGVTVSQYLQQTGRTICVDPVNGNDSTGNGTAAAPYATILSGAVPVAKYGDTIQLAAGAVVREPFIIEEQQIPDGVSLCGAKGSRATFTAYDPGPTSWTASSGSYMASVTHLWGGTGGAFNTPNRWYASVLCQLNNETTKLIQVRLALAEATGVYPWVLGTEAECLAYVAANPGTFYVQPTSGTAGSSYSTGWKAGQYNYFVNPPNGGNPSAYTIKIGQRPIPTLGFDSKVSDINFWGGIGHNGLDMYGGRVERVEIAYPGAHGGFFPGCTTVDMTVRELATDSPTTYAIHHYALSQNYSKQRIAHHIRCKVLNWMPGAVVGCHGNDSGVITDAILFDDFYGYNIGSVAGATNISVGVWFNNPIFDRVQQIGANICNTTLVNPRIIGDSLGAEGGNSALFVAPSAAGVTLNIVGGSSTTNGQLLGSTAGNGSIVMSDHRCVFGRENINNRWALWQGGAFIARRCVFECDMGDYVNLPGAAGSGGTMNLYSCAISGVQDLKVAGSIVTLDALSIQGGKTGMVRSMDAAAPVTLERDNLIEDLGDVTLDFQAWPAYTGQLANLLLTTSGFRFLQSSYQQAAPTPISAPGEVLNGLAILDTATDSYLAYGQNGLLYRSPSSGTTWTKKAIGTTTQNFIGYIYDAGDGIAWLLTDTGSIWKYVASGDTLTLVTSLASYPLIGGVKNGAVLLAWGSNYGNTAGGCVYSSNTGATWTASSSMTSTKIKTGGFVNGVYFLIGDAMEFWTATDPTSTWTSRGFFGYGYNVKHCTVDANHNRIVFNGDTYVGGPAAVGQAFGYIDASAGATIGSWTCNILNPPTGCLSRVVWNPTLPDGLGAIPQYMAVSKLGRVYVSEDLANWHPSLFLRQPYPSTQPWDSGLRDQTLGAY